MKKHLSAFVVILALSTTQSHAQINTNIPTYQDPATGSGYYYDSSTGYYFDRENGYYYDASTGAFYPSTLASGPTPPQPLPTQAPNGANVYAPLSNPGYQYPQQYQTPDNGTQIYVAPVQQVPQTVYVPVPVYVPQNSYSGEHRDDDRRREHERAERERAEYELSANQDNQQRGIQAQQQAIQQQQAAQQMATQQQQAAQQRAMQAQQQAIQQQRAVQQQFQQPAQNSPRQPQGQSNNQVMSGCNSNQGQPGNPHCH